MQVESGYELRRGRIELVPLIDVVFLLLVFFIYASLNLTVQRGIQVRLPRGQGSTDRLSPLVVTIAADNRLEVEGRKVSAEDVVRLVQAQVKEQSRPVLIRGDGRSDLKVSVELLVAFQSAGVESVSFQVQPEP